VGCYAICAGAGHQRAISPLVRIGAWAQRRDLQYQPAISNGFVLYWQIEKSAGPDDLEEETPPLAWEREAEGGNPAAWLNASAKISDTDQGMGQGQDCGVLGTMMISLFYYIYVGYSYTKRTRLGEVTISALVT
jgi:hypothetical protein